MKENCVICKCHKGRGNELDGDTLGYEVGHTQFFILNFNRCFVDQLLNQINKNKTRTHGGMKCVTKCKPTAMLPRGLWFPKTRFVLGVKHCCRR